MESYVTSNSHDRIQLVGGMASSSEDLNYCFSFSHIVLHHCDFATVSLTSTLVAPQYAFKLSTQRLQIPIVCRGSMPLRTVGIWRWLKRPSLFLFIWIVLNAHSTGDICVAMSFCFVTLSRVNSRLRETHTLLDRVPLLSACKYGNE